VRRRNQIVQLNTLRTILSKQQMRRKAVIFVLLLPFWLAAAAFDCPDVFDGSADSTDYRSDESGGGHGEENSTGDVAPVKHALQHLSRRVVSAMANRFISGTATIADAESVSPGLGFGLVESPADLHQSWQFYLRVASEPRAPSLVS
jgi:hypothetical protein